MPTVLDLLAHLASLLFDTLLMDIPYYDVAASTLTYAAICFWSARF